jgi:putative phosphoribosyl transferase
MSFANRKDAGRRLADALASYREKRPIVVALPRGGVVVAAEIAAALDAPLDLLLVRKIGVPFQPELAMGAIVDGPEPTIVRNEDVIRLAGVDARDFSAMCRTKQAELKQRRQLYLGSRGNIPLSGRVIILVDDGIATGSTVKAALQAIRKQKPEELVLAVPVAPAQSLDELGRGVDALVCLEAPLAFDAVGYFYADFRQVTDAEVISALETAKKEGPEE